MSEAKRTAAAICPKCGELTGPKNTTQLDPRIVKRYHAFEPGGAVEQARETLREALEMSDIDAIEDNIVEEWNEKARAALAALDAATESK